MNSIPVSFDGGETGCGELLLELRVFMRAQPSGVPVMVRALDAGAPLEIPAWCRLTGCRLVAADPPLYTLQNP